MQESSGPKVQSPSRTTCRYLWDFIPVLILVVAIAPRLFLWWSRLQFGLDESPPGTLVLFSDFTAYYVKQLAYLSQGYLPYRDIPYSQTPLFLYALYPLYVVDGTALASLLLVLSDAVSSLLIYLVVKRLAGDRVAILAGLAYAFSPLAVFYEGLLWMNSQPMLLLVLFSFYLSFREKSVLSSVAYGVAVMFKQDALFVLPAYAIWQLFKGRKFRVVPTLSFLGTLALVSLPFLVLTPVDYLDALSYGLLGSDKTTLSLSFPGGGNVLSQPLQSVINPVCSYTANVAQVIETCTSGSSITIFSHSQNLSAALEIIGEMFGPFVVVILGVLLFPAVLMARRWTNGYLLVSVYSSIVFLVVFNFEVHFIYRYYLLLPYALLLTASLNWRMIVSTVSAMVLAVYLPEGNFQLILLLGALLVAVVLQDASNPKSTRNPSNINRVMQSTPKP